MTLAEPDLVCEVAGHADLPAVEACWWRLLMDQQEHDFRGDLNDLKTLHNVDRVRRFLESRVRQSRLAVARRDGQLAGICTFAPDHFILDTAIAVWEVSDVYIEPHLRRQGIAKALVAFAEHECRMRGAQEIRLTVYSTNEAALHLYEDLGYGPVSHVFSKRMEE